MFGVAFHPPALVNLMIDRDKFSVVFVPSDFEEKTKESLELLFSKRPPKGVERLLLVESVDNISKLASLFPEQKVRILVFDVIEKLNNFVSKVIDTASTKKDSNSTPKLVSIKPEELNAGLCRDTPVTLEDYREQYREKDEKVSIAIRDGAFKEILKNCSKPLQKTACAYLLGQSSFAALKRAARKDGSKVSMVSAYVDSDKGLALNYAFMDVALYGTDSKEAAIFAEADLEDLNYMISIVPPDSEFEFAYAVPDKLRSARE